MIRSRRSIQVRRIRVWLAASAAIALIPWIAVLTAALGELPLAAA